MKEIVIKLADNYYKRVVDYKVNLPTQILEAIRHGAVLPKGHGKLIDADDIDNHIIGHVDTRSCPTIIEADTAESEGE